MASIPKKRRKVKKKKTSRSKKAPKRLQKTSNLLESKKRRSRAAKKGWETRRKREREKLKKLSAKERRSLAAKKGWETRRKKKKRVEKRERDARERRIEKHPEIEHFEELLDQARREAYAMGFVAGFREREEQRKEIVRQRFLEFDRLTEDWEYTLESKVIRRLIDLLHDEQGGLKDLDDATAREVLEEFSDQLEDDEFLDMRDIYDIWYYGEIGA